MIFMLFMLLSFFNNQYIIYSLFYSATELFHKMQQVIDQLQNLVTKLLRNIETRLIMQNESFIDFLARKLK